MLREAVLVAVEGAAGAVAGWLLSKAIRKGYVFPIGALAVNVFGLILLGFVMASASMYGIFSRGSKAHLSHQFREWIHSVLNLYV